MKAIATSLLLGLAAAEYTLNSTYDNPDAGHLYYGEPNPASPSMPYAPDLHDAVDAFDPHGTLFGEHRYQLQVAKTGNMLIGVEAIRESIAALENRVHYVYDHVQENGSRISANDADIEANRGQIMTNRDNLYELDSRIGDLESGYHGLHSKLAVDREALIMMCHQYAYATTIPHECEPIIGILSGPVHHEWNWPTIGCPGEPPLPPFNHPIDWHDDHHDHGY